MMSGGREESQISLLLEKRRRIQLQVRERFSRYGDKPCDVLLQAALLPSGLLRMMEQLGLPASPHFEQQLSILARYLAEHGVDHFTERLKSRRRPSTQLERPQRSKRPWTPLDMAGPLFDENGDFTGPDRRAIQERRRRRSRRYDVATIRENKRFGRDRRQRRRRKTDRSSFRQG